jgi:hypothetical protein
MRQPTALRFLFLLFTALAIGLGAPSSAAADARVEAKAHYQAGVKAYSVGDYRTAIREFSTAQQLAPADLNYYNLALCHDKLGEAEPAIQNYKQYLSRVPNADKRTEIEASIARLEGALRSAAGKRAEEARVAEEARKAEDARKAEEARTKAEQARRKTGTSATPDPTTPPDVTPGAGAMVGVGSTGTPGSGQAVSTGDAQLDRAAAIDINAIRAQRHGMGGGPPPPGVGGQGAIGPQAGAGQGGAQGGYDPQAQGGQGMASTAPRTGSDPTPPGGDEPKQPTPVYKKWWFWAVVAVSAFVVYQIATEGSNPPNTRSRELPLGPVAPREQGMTLWRF